MAIKIARQSLNNNYFINACKDDFSTKQDKPFLSMRGLPNVFYLPNYSEEYAQVVARHLV